MEGEGRGCERLRIENEMMVFSEGIEPATSGLLIQDSTTGPSGHVMEKKFGKFLKKDKSALIHIYQEVIDGFRFTPGLLGIAKNFRYKS